MANRVELTDAYHKLTGAQLDNAGQVAKNQFLNLGSWRDDDIKRYTDAVIPEMNNAKRVMASYTSSYYDQIGALSGKKLAKLSVPATQLVTESLRNGTTAEAVFQRPFKDMWGSLAKGNNFTDSLQAGANRANSIARTEVQLAKRQAGLFVRNGNKNIVGYLRTLSGFENCALCYVASTQRYTKGDLLPIHPGCDCGETPIFGDTDVGRVIDEDRLNATHQAVSDRFGKFDAGGKEIDYTKITIHDHSELGPYLSVKGQKFTKVARSQLSPVLKAPKAVSPSVVKTFGENIRPKLKRISATRIADDIKLEHGDVFVPALKGKAKIQTLGAKTTAHLENIKKVGKDIDLEIDIRVKKAIGEISSPAEIAAAQKQIKLGEELLAKTNLEYQANVQRGVAAQQARFEARGALRAKELADDGFSPAAVKEYLNDFYGKEKVLRQATLYAESDFRNSIPGRKILDEIKGYVDDIADYKLAIPENVLPGTVKYNQIFAAKAKELLEEVREIGQGGPKFVGSAKANDILEEARKIYPSDWLEKAAIAYPEIKSKQVTRGYWNYTAREIAISFDRNKGFGNGYSTAVHEMGHMFEYSVPGIKELEFAFAHQRAAKGSKRTNLGTREAGFQDQWRNLYTGKDYGYNTNSAYEIFTTGIESVFSGSGMFDPAGSQSRYINGALGADAGTDVEFRQFILGVLFAL